MTDKMPKGSVWIVFYKYYTGSNSWLSSGNSGNGYQTFICGGAKTSSMFIEFVSKSISEKYGTGNFILTGMTRLV